MAWTEWKSVQNIKSQTVVVEVDAGVQELKTIYFNQLGYIRAYDIEYTPPNSQYDSLMISGQIIKSVGYIQGKFIAMGSTGDITQLKITAYSW